MSAPWLVRNLAAKSTGEVPTIVKLAVDKRANQQCECCGGPVFVGFQSQHHRRPSGMGGTKNAAAHTVSNLVRVCGRDNKTGCHGDIHQNPEQARENGWLVRQGADPARVPLRLWDGRSVLLSDDGRYLDAS